MAIVQDDKMSGEPRLDGHRITVYQVWTMSDVYDDPTEIADQLRITEEEVEEALAYADSHPEEMAALAESRESFREQFEGSTIPDSSSK